MINGEDEMRILLVEDEKRMADALGELLRQEKYEVDCFYDGLSGLAVGESGIYDMMILDVMLPEMDGFEIVKKLRQKRVHTPVLMLTGCHDI